MIFDFLVDEAIDKGLIVKKKPLQGNEGRICGNRIAIKYDLGETRSTCVLAEELGHYYTTVGDILDQSDINNLKQEYRARMWAYNKLLSVDIILDAVSKGYTELWAMAEYLEVDEEFLKGYLECQGIVDIWK